MLLLCSRIELAFTRTHEELPAVFYLRVLLFLFRSQLLLAVALHHAEGMASHIAFLLGAFEVSILFVANFAGGIVVGIESHFFEFQRGVVDDVDLHMSKSTRKMNKSLIFQLLH